MDRKWNQLIAAFLMGILMPAAAVRLGSLFVKPPENQATHPQEETKGTVSSEQPPQTALVYIPVLMDGGTVRLMELEEYITGVILGEMPPSFEAEALKAQAVAARTYTLYSAETQDKHPGSAVCTRSTCCQAYYSAQDYIQDGGGREDLQKVQDAVMATSGQVVTYEGNVIQASYFSCSGGRTEEAVAVWGSEIPYLQSVESPGEEQAPIFTNTVFFTAEEFSSMLGRSLAGEPESWLGAVTYTNGGGVATMVVAGRSYTGTELRKLLELNSTAFTMTAENNGVRITTTGKGHRVGMSQYGADAMAAAGSTWQQILAHYYPGTRIDKMRGIG